MTAALTDFETEKRVPHDLNVYAYVSWTCVAKLKHGEPRTRNRIFVELADSASARRPH